MNQTQVKYARERAASIYKRRCADLTKKHTVEAVILTTDEKLKALKAGAFTVKPAKDRRSNYSWSENVIFAGEIKGGLDDKYEMAKAQLDAAFTRLNDELVLGDNEQALRLLEAFDA